MKIAIVHDWVVDIGGAEKCLAEFADIFERAPIYTLLHSEKSVKRLGIAETRVHDSFVARLPFSKKKYRSYLAFFPMAVEQFDLTEFDVVISSSHAVAKGVMVNAQQLHVCFCHSPIRYAWDLYHQYLRESGLDKGFKGLVAKLILHYIRIWDALTANRVDFFVANSRYISDRIRKVYGRESAVIYPPVDVDRFELYTGKRDDFYLTASRMVPYKKIDLIVEAFSRMPDKKLVVIGDGPAMKKIRQNAGENIEIMGYQPFDVLKDYMQRSKAFVFAAKEDFGIIPVEAQACGTPVIAFGEGGARETVIEGQTGLFFQEQTVESLSEAIRRFEQMAGKLDSQVIRKNAERFSHVRFREEFKKFVDQKIQGKWGVRS